MTEETRILRLANVACGKRILGLCLALLGFAALFAPASAFAVEPAGPQWDIQVYGQPTNFDPASTEDMYFVRVTNIGNGPSVQCVPASTPHTGRYTNSTCTAKASPANTGEYESVQTVITDSVPAGLKVNGVEFLFPGESGEGIASVLCNTTGSPATGVTVQCTYPSEYAFLFTRRQPGEWIAMQIHVQPEPGVEGPLVDSVAVSGGGAPDAFANTGTHPNGVSATPASWGWQGLEVAARNRDGTPYSTAGGHPYQLVTTGYFNTKLDAVRPIEHKEPIAFPLENPKNLFIDLPPGLIGNVNPNVVEPCSLASFWSQSCPINSQVGTIRLTFGFGHNGETGYRVATPFYEMEPERGKAGAFGFLVFGGIPFILNSSVRSGSDYGVRTSEEGITGVLLTSFGLNLWGVPADPRHNPQRGQECIVLFSCSGGGLASTAQEKPFLRMPTDCSAESLAAGATASSWERPDNFVSTTAPMEAPSGCNAVPFNPTVKARPSTPLSDAPSGLNVELEVPQNEDPNGIATADLKDTVLTLPRGMRLNPSAASGLTGCAEAQMGYVQGTVAPVEFSPDPAQCPDSSKIGTVEIDTPLLDHPLPASGNEGIGAVYLAKPTENPFGSLLALYIVVEDEPSGTLVKLAGKVHADPQTGQLTTTFEESPQLPFEDFTIKLFGGAQGALRTPSVCGTYASKAVLTPWSAPESGPPAQREDAFPIAGNCASSEAEEPNAPVFHVGTEAPQAGQYSPLSLRLVREDGSQEIHGFDAVLPEGLTGKLAGVSYCPESDIALAIAREHEGGGAEEQASHSCPAASEVGVVDIGAGAGPDPYYVHGRAYLAGPYKGAPISIVVITPAVAGPFDLGTVVVRAALNVDPETAEIHAVSDPIPTILQGIPLDVRSITLKVNRPQFTLNPTSCDEMFFSGSEMSALGQITPLTQRFQVGGCPALGFKPSLALALKGGTKRTGNPALTATLTMPPGNANIATAQVTLPPSELLDQSHINTVCTKVQFNAGSCPVGSVYGSAMAITPLLSQPLEGPVYLRSSTHELPDLVADLNGQLHIVLVGRTDSGLGGGLRNTFEAVPDAPVSKFVLKLDGGKKGLLENSTDICASKQSASAVFTGHNGKLAEISPKLKVRCRKGGKHGPKGHKGKHHRPAARAGR
jgi:hypothetical protein